MATLLILIVAGITAALFGSQNTQITSVTFAQYTFHAVPVYLIVLGAILVGILVSAIIDLVKSISSSIEISGKEGNLKAVNREIAELTKEVHQLELENTRLKTQLGELEQDENSM